MNLKFKASMDNKSQDSVELALNYCGIEECEPGYYYSPPKRSIYLIHIILSGKGTVKIGSKTFSCSKDEAFLIPAYTKGEYAADKEDPWTYIWIGFSGLKAYEYLRGTGFGNQKLVRKMGCTERLREIIMKMLEIPELTLLNELRRNSMMQWFLSEMIEDYQKMCQKQEDFSYPVAAYIHYAKEFLVENYNRKVRIDELANRIGINRSYLTKSFKKITGYSPQQFVVNLRMEKAVCMLKNTDCSIKEIAMEIGYENPLTFSKLFKQRYGISPKNFRNASEPFPTVQNDCME